MIKKVVSLLAVGVVSIALYGQANPNPSNDRQGNAERSADANQSVTGCLTESGGSYMIASSTGAPMEVMGSADLSKHKNHTVKITGTTSDQAGKKVLNASKIEMVSSSCSK